MNPSDIMLILGGVASLLVSLGGAAKWILTYIDTKTNEALQKTEKAQAELRSHLEREIHQLTEQLNIVTQRESLYYRRIIQLESFLREKGLDLPPLDGWPPQ